MEKERVSGETGSSALEMALMFWFSIIAICFFYGLYKLLQWIYNKRRFLQKTDNWIAHNIIVTLMRGLYRIAVYALVTAIVEGIFIWRLFTYAETNKLTIWFVLAENLVCFFFLLIRGLPLPGSLH